MPSPFPGMDPYLEGSEWGSFHSQLIVSVSRQLAPQLRPRYVALVEKRFVFDSGHELDSGQELSISTQNGSGRRDIYPDVGIAERDPTASMSQSAPAAVLEPTLQIPTVVAREVPQRWVEIRDVAERRLITIIELLSPANKRGRGYSDYVERREEILASRAHLLEIDLLRQGHRVPMRDTLPAAPYYLFLSRARRRPLTDVWAIALDQPLPRIGVPLLPGDKDVVLDLQAAFTDVYDSIGYDLLLRYEEPPDVPLADEAAAWARSQIEAWSSP